MILESPTDTWRHAGEELRLAGDVWTAPAEPGRVYVFRSF